MSHIKLNIKTKTQKYPIFIGRKLSARVSQIAKSNSINFKKCLLVVDNNVPKKFISNIKKSLENEKIYIHYFKATEKNKNINSVNIILEILLNKNFSREDSLISVGGGITGDISGLAASLFKRGLKFINMPTTLLSQVDSSIGGKTGVNSKYGKNLIGSFYQPHLVISDTLFLETLPQREIICGYGEILKHSLVGSKKFYNYLDKYRNKILNLYSPFLENAIYESCKIKKIIVEKDEKEQGLRKILNFGHSFAHAFEATLGFTKKLNHGEAVILGMIAALNFSIKTNYMNKGEYYSIISHINNSNLPSSIRKFFSPKDSNKILSFMTKDKKNKSDKINLVLLRKIGVPLIDKEYSRKKLSLFFENFLRN